MSETTAAPSAPGARDTAPGGRRARRAARQRTRTGTGGRLAALPLFLLPAAVALAAALHGIGTRQPWRDEHATWWAATLSFHDLSLLIRHTDVAFTPYYVLMHAWIAVAGDSPTALRLPAALAMGASAGLLALLGRRIFTARTGLVAGLALALLPTVTRYGQESGPYAFAVAAVLLSTLLLVRALQRPGFKVWVGYTLSVPLIGWSDLVAVTVLAAHLTAVLLARRSGDRIAGWAFTAAGTLGLCFVVPAAVQAVVQNGASTGTGVAADLAAFPGDLFGSWAVAVPVLVLAVLGLCCAGRRALPLAVWIALPLPVALAAGLFSPAHLLFTTPAWALLAAVALSRLAWPVAGARAGAGGPVLRVLGGVLAAAALAGLAWQALPALRQTGRNVPGEPDYRAAARLVETGQRKGDGIAFSGAGPERRAMAYELRDDPSRPRDVLMYRTPQRRGAFEARECPQPASCLAKTDRLWLVSTVRGGAAPEDGMPEATARILDRSFHVTRITRLTGLRLVLLDRVRDTSGTKGDDEAARRKVHV
ncbi:glycosyltransferase family 39 protein [Streptomyces sp. NPDC047000]|uniref:glycosyltransferase family 39 protein n=1 Tax=Streptomyces sp. NPDC047000 TaxID=3155474 RepID=UPI0034092A4C